MNMFKIKNLTVKKFMSVSNATQGNVNFESVDQIVTGSEHYDNNLLLDIYRNL